MNRKKFSQCYIDALNGNIENIENQLRENNIFVIRVIRGDYKHCRLIIDICKDISCPIIKFEQFDADKFTKMEKKNYGKIYF